MIGGHVSCLILCSMETQKIVWNFDEAKLTAKWFCIAQHAWSTNTLRQKELHISCTQWLVKAECLMFYSVFTIQASITHRLSCVCRRRHVHTSRHSTLSQSAVTRNEHHCLHPKWFQDFLAALINKWSSRLSHAKQSAYFVLYMFNEKNRPWTLFNTVADDGLVLLCFHCRSHIERKREFKGKSKETFHEYM